MPTILVITDNLKDQINGVVTTFKNIEGPAAADGYRIVYLDPGQFHYINCPGYSEVKLSWPWRIGKKIKAVNPDYIHIATEGPLGFTARCWLDAKGWRYNTSYHTKFPDFLKKIYGVPEFITYSYLRWFHKHSGRVLTTTQTMVDELKSHRFNGDIKPWSRGVDYDIFRSELRLSPVHKPPIMLYVGRVSKEKNIDDFCNLKLPGTKVVIGDGPYRQQLEKTYPDVKFLGAMKGKRLAYYYANADVFVFPSKTDTFGIVIIESLACGTPVAAYPVPGPKDIIINGLTGILSWSLSEAVERCLNLNRTAIVKESQNWTWQRCWDIFQDNLIETSKTK